jgi:hypothetical protein
MSRKSTPGAQKLDSVSHFFYYKRADQAQQAPHLLTVQRELLVVVPDKSCWGIEQAGFSPTALIV